VHRRSNPQSNEAQQTHTKKKRIEYSERDGEKRAAYQAEISEVPESKRYYIDESGINQYLYREYGYALRGKPVYGKIPGKKYERLSMVAAQCGNEVIGRYEYTCNMNSKLFELWFSEVLLKLIPVGSVIIMDNASWHRKKVLKALAEAAGCRIIFLPPYSPDFSPIEQTWANLKTFIRNYMRNFTSLTLAVLHFFEVG
jgi:transposase